MYVFFRSGIPIINDESFYSAGTGRADDDAWSLRAANEVSRVISEAIVLATRGRVSRRGLRGRPRGWEEVRREGSMRCDGILCMHPRTTPPGLLLCLSSPPSLSSLPPPRPFFGGTPFSAPFHAANSRSPRRIVDVACSIKGTGWEGGWFYWSRITTPLTLAMPRLRSLFHPETRAVHPGCNPRRAPSHNAVMKFTPGIIRPTDRARRIREWYLKKDQLSWTVISILDHLVRFVIFEFVEIQR